MYYNSNILKIGSHMMIQKGTADVFITMRRCVVLPGYGWLPGCAAHLTHTYTASYFWLQLRNVSGVRIVDKDVGGYRIPFERQKGEEYIGGLFL